MFKKIALFFTGVFLAISLLSCTGAKANDVNNIKITFYNWYNCYEKTEIDLSGTIALKDNELVDGGNDELNSFTDFTCEGDIYYQDKIVNVLGNINYENENERLNYYINNMNNIYFTNNNYFYITSTRGGYGLSAIITYIYINEYNLNYALPLPLCVPYYYFHTDSSKFEEDKAKTNSQIFDNYSFTTFSNFYSKFTDYVTINNDNKTISVVSTELHRYRNQVLKRITTTFDFSNKTIYVKTDGVDIEI